MIIKRTNVVALIEYKNRFLIIRRSLTDDSMPGVWELPCGGVEEGEEKINTVIREVKEEVGIDIDNPTQIMEDNYSFTKENGDIKEINATIFKVILDKEPQIELSEEHIDYQWITYKKEDLLKYFGSEDDLYYKRIIKIQEG